MRKLILILLLLLVASSFAAELQRTVPEKSQVMSMQTMAPTGRIVVKYSDESGIVIDQIGLSTSFGEVARHFSTSMDIIDADRLRGELIVGHKLPNLNRYGVVDPGTQNREQLLQLLSQILQDPDVETAYLEPVAVPASLGFDAFTGDYTGPEILAPEGSRFSPDYQSQQGYLGAPPVGVNALAVDGIPGARGADMQMLDIEGAWLWAHEDLPVPFYTAGSQYNDLDWRNHGTAVLGEIRGSDNGLGVRGITPECAVGGVSIATMSVSAALYTASMALDVGDVILIELHAPGPNSNGSGQFGYVPMEYWQANFDAIQVATANGRIICEAAGNGEQDLDDPVYGSTFDPNFRDSGAIMCGAATSSGYPEWFTNYGARVDVNGWGSSIVTCGYGDLQSGDEELWYTSNFGGTSGASPIIVGSVVALQGIIKDSSGTPLDPFSIREVLKETGSPQNGVNHVGPRPDILAAWESILYGNGTFEGTVSDSEGPVQDVTVTVQSTGTTATTDAAGFYSIITDGGIHTLEFRSFFHTPLDSVVELLSSNTVVVDATLALIPTTDISGMITTENGTTASNARCTVVGSSLVADTSAGDGSFLLSGVPVGTYHLLFDYEPGFGADVATIDTGVQTTVNTELAVADNSFELWWESYDCVDDSWTWGVPQAGPNSGFSSTKCWGIGMDGTGYDIDSNAIVEAPGFTFYTYNHLFLSFHYWCDTEEGVDGVQLQVFYDSQWQTLTPLSGYNGNVSSFDNQPAWTGNSNGWKGAVFDIEQYANFAIQFRLVLKSDDATSGTGFFFDDVTFDDGNTITAVDLPVIVEPQISIYPNPFNPQTSISWMISEPGQLSIELFDMMGRKTRTLHDGLVTEVSGSITFDGKTDSGSNLSSGTYLLKMTDGLGKTVTQRLSLVR